MGVRLYDEALLNKIKNWTIDTNLSVLSVNDSSKLFRQILDKPVDKSLELPLLSLSRPKGFKLLSQNKKPLTFDGMTYDANIKKSLQLNALPIRIEYQLDIYSRYFAEADEYIRNLIFNIVNFPKLTIEIPYNESKILHDSNIRLTEDINDNSDIPERIISGQFYRMSLNLYIDDAYLFDVKIRDNYIIEANTSTNQEKQ